MIKKLSIFTILFILIDQFVKFIITNSLQLYQNIVVIKKFFSITHVHNTGAAFSILSDNVYLLICISFIALVLIYYFLIKGNLLKNTDVIIYSFLMGGIIGNLVDRILLGYVVDYLSFQIFNYNFPVFNLADIGIVVSISFMIISSIKEEVCRK